MFWKILIYGRSSVIYLILIFNSNQYFINNSTMFFICQNSPLIEVCQTGRNHSTFKEEKKQHKKSLIFYWSKRVKRRMCCDWRLIPPSFSFKVNFSLVLHSLSLLGCFTGKFNSPFIVYYYGSADFCSFQTLKSVLLNTSFTVFTFALF